jgi:Ca-activated chloride channel family protein
MFRFANNEYLYFLLIIPLLIIIYAISRQIRKRNINAYGNIHILSQLMPDASEGRPVVKFSLLLFALTWIIFSLARPQFGSKLEEIKRKGIEIVIALDVSNSMMAEDIQPSRLERAKQAISKLIEKLQDDKIGLIVFAGDSYTQIPITSDYSSAKMFLSAISTEIVPRQGTAIGSAIDLGMNSFTPDMEASKVLIVITDGENHEDDAIETAKKAAGKGIIVHTIGIGLPKGAPLPVYTSTGQKVFRKDKNGNTIISKLDESMLQQIAAAGKGVYIRSTNTRLGLNALFDEINKMEKQEFEARIYSDYDERFQYMIGMALFFLLLEFIILERKNKYLKNIKLFKIK